MASRSATLSSCCRLHRHETHGAVSFPKRGGRVGCIDYTQDWIGRTRRKGTYLKLSWVELRVRLVPSLTRISYTHLIPVADPMSTMSVLFEAKKSIIAQFLRGTRGETRGRRVLFMPWVMKTWVWRRGILVSVTSKGEGLTFRCRTARMEEEHGYCVPMVLFSCHLWLIAVESHTKFA